MTSRPRIRSEGVLIGGWPKQDLIWRVLKYFQLRGTVHSPIDASACHAGRERRCGTLNRLNSAISLVQAGPTPSLLSSSRRSMLAWICSPIRLNHYCRSSPNPTQMDCSATLRAISSNPA
jgi:hypothetical protein